MTIKTLLSTNLDSAASITTPLVGPSGTVKGMSFLTGAVGKGLRAIKSEKYAKFPKECISVKNCKLQFKLKPNFTLSTDDSKHVLFVVGDAYGVANSISLEASDRQLKLSVIAPDGVYSVTTEQGATGVLSKNKWADVMVEWNASSNDSLIITVNGVRRNSSTLGSWSITLPETAMFYLGCGGSLCPWFADSTIDELTVTSDDSIAEPPPPPPPPPPSDWNPLVGTRLAQGSTGAVVAKVSLSAPAVGASVVDTAFGNVSMKRLTTVAGPVYSQLQAFSADERYILLVQPNVGYRVYEVATGAPVSAINDNATWRAGTAPRWHGNKLYFFGQPNPPRMHSIDTNGTVTTVWTGTSARPYYKGAQVEEQIAEDGSTVAWVHNGTSASVVAFNVLTGQTLASIDLRALPNVIDPQWGLIEPNWAAVSPLGKFIVLAWARDGGGRSAGTELFDINTGAFVRNVFQGHAHGDMCVLPDGREAYVTVNVDTSDPTIHYFDGTPKKVIRTMAWGSFGHASCRGPKDWVLISGFNLAGSYVGKDEIYLMKLTGANAGEIVRLCHHRSVGDYWTQPKATISPSGRYIVWNDNFGSGQAFCMIAQIS